MRERDIPYRDKLNAEAKARYLIKVSQLDGFDPYDHTLHTETVWMRVTQLEEYDLLPPLTDVSIYQYLVCGMNYCTLDDFNNRRCVYTLG